MGCALWGWCEDGSQMHGDGVGMVVTYMGLGWEWKKFHVDGMGMGLIFTTVSLFTEWVIT